MRAMSLGAYHSVYRFFLIPLLSVWCTCSLRRLVSFSLIIPLAQPLQWVNILPSLFLQIFSLSSYLQNYAHLVFRRLPSSTLGGSAVGVSFFLCFPQPYIGFWLSLFTSKSGYHSRQIYLSNFQLLKISFHPLCTFIITVLVRGFQKEAKINVFNRVEKSIQLLPSVFQLECFGMLGASFSGCFSPDLPFLYLLPALYLLMVLYCVCT